MSMSSHSLLRRSSSRVGIVVEHLERLLLVGAGVGLDLLDAQHRAQLRAAARVADARGEVADDQHDEVAGVLEVAQLAQHDGVAEVDVGRRRVDAELDAQRAPERQLALELAGRQHLGGAARELARAPARRSPAQC